MSKTATGSIRVNTNATKDSVCRVGVEPVRFAQLWDNYVSGNPFADSGGQYGNQCAIRLSYTFHKVGIKMKSFSQRTVSPMPGAPSLGRILHEGNPAATRAFELAEWLKLVPFCGLPAKPEDITGKDWEAKVKGRTGILLFHGYWTREGQSAPMPLEVISIYGTVRGLPIMVLWASWKPLPVSHWDFKTPGYPCTPTCVTPDVSCFLRYPREENSTHRVGVYCGNALRFFAGVCRASPRAAALSGILPDTLPDIVNCGLSGSPVCGGCHVSRLHVLESANRRHRRADVARRPGDARIPFLSDWIPGRVACTGSFLQPAFED